MIIQTGQSRSSGFARHSTHGERCPASRESSRALPAVCAIAAVCLIAAIQTADGQTATHEQSGNAALPVALEGLWPSDALTNSLLIRWSDTVMGDYDLSDDQRQEIRDAVSERWGGFLRENRSRLQPILNEFLELRLAPEPPTAAQFQSWAERAAPVLDLAGEELLAGNDDFRQPLSPLQRAKFELDAIGLNAGIQLAKQRLARWRQGDIDVASVWEPTRSARQRNEKIDNQSASKAATKADADGSSTRLPRTDKIVEELNIWEAYAARFITLYQLDEAQRATALSCLYELTARAHSHRKLYRKQIAELEYRIKSGFEPNKQEEMIASLKKLYGPIDQMFRELKDRLNGIPSTAQKDGAAIMLPFEPLLSGQSERPALTDPASSRPPAGAGSPKVDNPE